MPSPHPSGAAAAARDPRPTTLAEPPQSWTVLYDADCGLCKSLTALLLRWDRDGGLRPLALQTEEAAALLGGLTPAERMGSWHLISPAGVRYSGGAAFEPLLRTLPAGAPAAAVLARSPALAERAYRLIAEHRAWIGGWIPDRAKRRAGQLILARERRYGPANPPA